MSLACVDLRTQICQLFTPLLVPDWVQSHFLRNETKLHLSQAERKAEQRLKLMNRLEGARGKEAERRQYQIKRKVSLNWVVFIL